MVALSATAWSMAILPTPGAIVTSAGVETNVAAGGVGVILGKIRCVRVRMTMDNAADLSAYPTSGGVPLPSFEPAPSLGSYDWGMIRNLDYIVMYGRGHTASGLATQQQPFWEYSPTQHSMVGWEVLKTISASLGPTEAVGPVELGTAWTPTLSPIPTVLYFTAYGW